ncbi:phosphate ABC transporter substrate-binding protein [Mesoplasma chauliocola]|uniref:Phosphate ABC transporter substrate-binding protein n=1 Tax=Mesoplasma chauliocola TaxID=216427 RepID=A0A249SN19_9MOLU|nr:phosphate ABC transporter substrate-binding protein [Mesoplasma chauliocola]ASZ08989.1 phosphate ABC transporter substrate-binding protein [Mesoplasma chauliocola]
MNKKFFLVMVIVVGAIIGLWSWTFVAPNNSISIGGSASVQPLLKKLTDKYTTADGKKFVYSATGSGAGVTNVQEGVYEIGFISKEILSDDWKDKKIINESKVEEGGVFEQLSSEDLKNPNWYSEKLKEQEDIEDTYRSIEFARDSIVFVYNDKGTGFSEFLENTKIDFHFEVLENGKFDPNGTSTQLLKEVYEHDSQNKLITWQQLALSIADKFSDDAHKETNKQEALKVSNKIKVTPYSSTSGSGTRTSFTSLTDVHPGNAVKEYGANGTIYSQIEKSPGSIGFVSMLYGSAESSTVKSVKIKKDNNEWDPSNDNSEQLKDYPLTRPFIAIYKYDSNNEHLSQIIDFLFWMATSKEVESFYSSVGLSQKIVNDIRN